MKTHFIQQYGYRDNEHFAPHFKEIFTQSDNIAIKELIDEIDAIVDYAVVNGLATPATQQQIDQRVQRIKQIIDTKAAEEEELKSCLNELLANAAEVTKRYLTNMTKNKDFTLDLKDPNDDRLTTLRSQGFLQFQFQKNQEFTNWSESQLHAARAKYEGQDDWRGANSYLPDSAEYQIIERFLEANDIIPLISAYKGMNMKLCYAAWDYSHNRQKWFRNNHEYDQLSPTNYYHYDADEDIAKMLIYLTDVKEGDGPFRLVRGSNTLSRSLFANYLHLSNDSILSRRFADEDDLYGRGLFVKRKDLLMKFPQVFIGSTHFGDDLIEGSPLSDYLLQNTEVFYAEKGTAVLFDGFLGIHAGSNAAKGERLAVQVAFRRAGSMEEPTSLLTKIKGRIKSKLVRS